MFILSDVSASMATMNFGSFPSAQDAWILEKPATGSQVTDIESTAFNVDAARLSVSVQGTSDTNASREMMADTSTQDSPVTVPVPASVWLLGTGLICLIGLGRRKF